jgi:hypothetical protein
VHFDLGGDYDPRHGSLRTRCPVRKQARPLPQAVLTRVYHGRRYSMPPSALKLQKAMTVWTIGTQPLIPAVYGVNAPV